jgi:hypothetical protein
VGAFYAFGYMVRKALGIADISSFRRNMYCRSRPAFLGGKLLPAG